MLVDKLQLAEPGQAVCLTLLQGVSGAALVTVGTITQRSVGLAPVRKLYRRSTHGRRGKLAIWDQ